MKKVVKKIATFLVVMVLFELLGTLLFSSGWLMAIIVAVIIFLIIRRTNSHKKSESYGAVTKEYIVSGRGELLQEVNDSYFKNMELLEKNDEGRCFMDTNGSIVMTKYVQQKR